MSDDEDIARWYTEQRLSPEALQKLMALGDNAPARRRGWAWLPLAAIAACALGAWALWPERQPLLVAQPIPYAALALPKPEVPIPAGMRRTQVPVSNSATLSGFLNPGNFVDVLMSRPDAQGKPQTRTLYQSLFVLEVQPQAGLVSLLTTPEQDRGLLAAAGQGEIALAMRNDLDVNMQSLPGVDIDDLRSKLQITQQPVQPALAPAQPMPRQATLSLQQSEGMHRTSHEAVSTFAMDVDTASWSWTRAQLQRGQLPDPAQVRVEEFVNALPYDYPRPEDGLFAASFEMVPSPWTQDHQLVRVGLRAKDLPEDSREPLHLTFLVDTSGSMREHLPLVKQSLDTLVDALQPEDTVALLSFADRARVILEPTAAREPVLHSAIASLQVSGGTALEQGLLAAYPLAASQLERPGAHRVVLCTDGMANIGEADAKALTAQIRDWSQQGIGLTALGFGRDGYRDAFMEGFADASDGNYAYIDSAEQARRVLSDQLMETMLVVARDAKVQVTWDARAVSGWRLIGYDDRRLAARDFRDDRVDAGEVGPGHRVTALYEVRLAEGASASQPLGALEIRAEPPGREGQPATTQRFPIPGASRSSLEEASRDTQMAIAAASFALYLAQSPLSTMNLERIEALARAAQRPEYPEDAALVDLVLDAGRAAPRAPAPPPSQRHCREFQLFSGGQKKIILVDEVGIPCQ